MIWLAAVAGVGLPGDLWVLCFEGYSITIKDLKKSNFILFTLFNRIRYISHLSRVKENVAMGALPDGVTFRCLLASW